MESVEEAKGLETVFSESWWCCKPVIHPIPTSPLSVVLNESSRNGRVDDTRYKNKGW